MKALAPRFGISDVTLKKTCARAHIPVPDRGWWAKHYAGKRAVRPSLPLRLPGMDDEVIVGGGRRYWYHNPSYEEILAPLPEPPSFPEPIEAVRDRVRPGIRKVGATRAFLAPHPVITALLKEDERRKENQHTSSYVFSWEAPLFDSPFEQRRLRILNALFLAVAGLDGKPWIRTKEPAGIGIEFHKRTVRLKLDHASPPKCTSRCDNTKPSAQSPLRLSILIEGEKERTGWQDGEAERLESLLSEIALEIVVTAELQYREAAIRSYEWRVKRKAQLEEEARQRTLEAQRREKERLAKIEKANVDRLLGEVAALRQANDIRAYVDAVCAALRNSTESSAPEELQQWHDWALAQTDRIDPIKGAAYLRPSDVDGATKPKSPSEDNEL